MEKCSIPLEAVFGFPGRSVPWWACPYCPPPASFIHVDAFCKENPVSHKMRILFYLIYINWRSRKEHFIQSCRFTKVIFPLGRISQELFLHLRSGKRKASLDKCCPSEAPSAGGVWTVCSCSPWRELLFCYRRLFLLPRTDKGTYYMFCLKQKSQRLDVSCICCQQNLCQDYVESW